MMTCPCVLMRVARWIIVYSLGKLTINLAGQVEMNVKCWPKIILLVTWYVVCVTGFL